MFVFIHLVEYRGLFVKKPSLLFFLPIFIWVNLPLSVTAQATHKNHHALIWNVSESANSVATQKTKIFKAEASSRKPNYEIEYVSIPAGEFMMGSEVEKPIHKVKISRSFEIGRYEVTQAQWEKVMKTTIAEQRDKVGAEFPLRGTGDDYPMYYVSWDEAQDFIKQLNAADDGYEYRLPTDAEWEYAARAGTTEDYPDNLKITAWNRENSNDSTHPVGSLEPNGWSLYDMNGNVAEWVQDCGYWYDSKEEIDPLHESVNSTCEMDLGFGPARSNRGDSWIGNADVLWASKKGGNLPDFQNSYLGFRLVRSRKLQPISIFSISYNPLKD